MNNRKTNLTSGTENVIHIIALILLTTHLKEPRMNKKQMKCKLKYINQFHNFQLQTIFDIDCDVTIFRVVCVQFHIFRNVILHSLIHSCESL